MDDAVLTTLYYGWFSFILENPQLILETNYFLLILEVSISEFVDGFDDVSGLFVSFVGTFDVVTPTDCLAELAEAFFAIGEVTDFILKSGDDSLILAGGVLEIVHFVVEVADGYLVVDVEFVDGFLEAFQFFF
jgi:hypothetical protein